MCGVIVSCGSRFCMTITGECTTASHAFMKGLAEYIPGGKDGVWLVMAKPSQLLL